MASSDGASTPVASEAPLDTKVEETLGQKISESQGGGESSISNGGVSSPLVEEDKTLECAAELMERGSKAMKAGDFTEATECFSRAVEIKVAHHGELAPECSSAYYKYGCALLYKAQEEADPLGTVPKKETDSLQNSENDGSVKSSKGECSTASVVSSSEQDGDSSHNEGEPDDGASEKDQVEDGDEESEGEDLAEPDEDDTDLDLAWKMLDVARAIVEKNPDDTMEKVDILSALGEVALEREDIETSLSDYLNALSILERLVEPDSRHIAELNFRMCLVLEVGSKPEEAIPYCQKAISVCKARLQRLMDEVKRAAGSSATVVVLDTNQSANPAPGGSMSDASVLDKEAEIETLTGLSSELEKKLEDLQQLILQPTSIFSEILKMVSAKSTGGEKSGSSSVMSSSRIGNDNSGGNFNSPTVSTGHTNGNGGVTHLGVVGRGVKRVLMNTGSADPSPTKKPFDSALEKGDGSVS